MMQKKSSATSSRFHSRIPPEHGGVQVNHCKSPGCMNYGIAAEQKSVPGSNRYTLEGKRGISSCLCTSCGVEFPLKSNIGIVEEIERLVSYLSPPAPLCCPNKDCANYAGRIPTDAAGAYASFGKTAIGNPRWRCNVCGKTFSQNLKATARQREPHKNTAAFSSSNACWAMSRSGVSSLIKTQVSGRRVWPHSAMTFKAVQRTPFMLASPRI